MARAIGRIDRTLILVLLATGDNIRMAAIAREEGITAVFEAFPDRAYTSQGTLVPRQHPGAVIHDPEEAAARAVRMVTEGMVLAVDGTEVPLSAQTLCVHGDNPRGVLLAATIRARLEEAGIAICPVSMD
jgi:UPF0271 protein